MYLQKVIIKLAGVLKVKTKIAGSGSGSIGQRPGSGAVPKGHGSTTLLVCYLRCDRFSTHGIGRKNVRYLLESWSSMKCNRVVFNSIGGSTVNLIMKGLTF